MPSEPDRRIDVFVVEMIYLAALSRGLLEDSSEQYWRRVGWSYYHERVRRRQQFSKLLIG